MVQKIRQKRENNEWNRSTEKTGLLQQDSLSAMPERNSSTPGRVKIKIVVQRQEDAGILGYGIIAEDARSQPIIGWGFRERIFGCQVKQEAEAVRLALSKLQRRGGHTYLWELLVNTC